MYTDPSVCDKDQQRNALHLAAWLSSPDIIQDILDPRQGKMYSRNSIGYSNTIIANSYISKASYVLAIGESFYCTIL